MKNVLVKGAKVLAPAALNTATKSTGYLCSFIFNQPKMPKTLDKFTRSK